MLLACLWLTLGASFDFDAALEDGAYGMVLAEAERAPESTPAQLAALIAAQRTGRLEVVERTLQALHDHGTDLGFFAADMTLWIAASRGQCADAEHAAESLQGSVYASQGWARVARCWAKEDALEPAQRAAEHYVELADTRSQRAGAALLRAELLVEARRGVEAVPLLRALVTEFPRTSEAAEAEGMLDRLRRRGLKGSRMTPLDLVAQADQDRADQRLWAAKRGYDEIERTSKKGSPQALLAQLGLAEIDMVHRSYSRALDKVQSVLEASRDPKASARALYLEGDILSRRGKVTEALQSYERLRRDHPDDPFAVEGGLAALRLAYGARQLDDARGLAQWLLANATGDRTAGQIVADDGVHRDSRTLGAARDHALWSLAWMSRREGRPAEEMDSYLQQVAADGPFALDAIYWRMRLASERGDVEATTVFAEMLTQKEPISFAALAARDLVRGPEGCPLDMPSIAGAAPSASGRPGAEPKDMRGAVVLFENGLVQTARSVLRTIPATDLAWEDRVAAAWLYRRCGELHLGTILARRAAAAAQKDGLDPVLLDLAFPRPFNEEVTRHASRHHVPAALVYAVMREESAFNPKAKSARAARGLMQMIPQTARAMAEEAQRLEDKKPLTRRFSPSKLYNPDTSVRLGVVYLRSLLERFDGNVPATIAAYHAGETAVDRWLASRGNLPADEFIEEIPFASTRGYVKHVMASYAVYRLLYAESPGRAFDMDVSRVPMVREKLAAN